ncbi:DUF4123 domain-containing protein (plasmid) [Paraburkholderia sprentiae WSM5005]|uniref:DUF4123 domain-containing protein n=1 Tax=Paraburkholderia sprentiae WSM5005 TaxID=754502 RepID=A0A1I9YS28_9BURK|nr:DUF4123 domain-containing protein [Paraburkholderia sprentiae]APA89745.1 DUF4123 domain-containing protein [Paraburkholderia sprentiae WSM5005]
MNVVPFQVERFAELTQWFESLGAGRDTPLQLYALVDGALNADMLRLTTEREAAWQCLYPKTMLEAASPAIAPYLVEIRLDNQGHAALARALLRQSERMDLVLWVASRVSLADMSYQLYPFAEVELADGRQALLRYYDPLILEALLMAFTPEQRERFVAPFRALRYWRGSWKDVEGFDHDAASLTATTDGLKLTIGQQQRLARATLAETFYNEIKSELLPPMSGIDSRTAIAHTRELLDRAMQQHLLKNRDELMLFTLIGLNINPMFDLHPAIVIHLDPQQRGSTTFQEKISSVPGDVWDELLSTTSFH